MRRILLKACILLVSIFLIGCLPKKETLISKSKFPITEFKGYGYVFFNQYFVDGRANIIFIPINKKDSVQFRKKIFNKKHNQYPLISIQTDTKVVKFLGYNDAYKTLNNQIVKIDNDYIISFKHRWKRVYISYKSYIEIFRYNQNDGKRTHKIISQNYNDFTRWIIPSDFSNIIEMRIIPPTTH